MKNLKNIVTVIALAIFMLNTLSVNAQESKIEKKEYEIKLNSKKKQDNCNSQAVQLYRIYDKKIKATISVIGYFEKDGSFHICKLFSSDKNLIHKLQLEANMNHDSNTANKAAPSNDGCPNGYRACARGCTDKPTTIGVIYCTIYCMIDCSE